MISRLVWLLVLLCGLLALPHKLVLCMTWTASILSVNPCILVQVVHQSHNAHQCDALHSCRYQDLDASSCMCAQGSLSPLLPIGAARIMHVLGGCFSILLLPLIGCTEMKGLQKLARCWYRTGKKQCNTYVIRGNSYRSRSCRQGQPMQPKSGSKNAHEAATCSIK